MIPHDPRIRPLDAEELSEVLKDETFKAFSDDPENVFEPAADFAGTSDRLREFIEEERLNVPPEAISPIECRIGLSKFFIPPVNIQVNTAFKSGSASGGALRQQSSPKFSTGHKETMISMTLYFPTVESIWGVDLNESLTLDFQNLDEKDERLDRFMSSLRGLITQFKYTPFLPVKNDHLNRVFGITGVALRGMTISSVPNFPYCLAVTLTMMKFNHRVYLPMIEDFDQAIHFGRLRQYLGRAAARVQQSARPFKAFTNFDQIETGGNTTVDPIIQTPGQALEDDDSYDLLSPQTFRSPKLDGSAQYDPKRFDLFYPFHTPANIDVPDLDDLRPTKYESSERARSWWERTLGMLGVDTDIYDEAHYEVVRRINEDENSSYYESLSEYQVLLSFLRSTNVLLNEMSPSAMNDYIDRRIDELGVTNPAQIARLESEIRMLWFSVAFSYVLESPAVAAQLARDDQRRRNLGINEWEIPMVRLPLDPSSFTVEGIAVSMGNSFSRIQLQMHDEPTHQHIGGEDTRLDVSLVFHGPKAEEELAKLRTMFDHVSGLARLEHSHGVLGFLGLKNVLSQLAGVRYVIPQNFSWETVEGYPHVFRVKLSFMDFDVFQRKREQLSTKQQAAIAQHFSKRNPMLRLRQLWGHINPYPDFPLEVVDDEGMIVGHLDPDYYFRAFKMMDDDVVSPRNALGSRSRIEEENQRRIEQGLAALNEEIEPQEVENEYGGVYVTFAEMDGKPQSVHVHDGGMDPMDGDEVITTIRPADPAVGVNTEATVEGLTPQSATVEHYFGGTADPRTQFELMAKDMQYRDRSGRMIRAFPTFMLWLINERGQVGGFNLNDDFYGLQSVLDIAIVRSEDIMADTLILKVSNLYSKLSTSFRASLEEGKDTPTARLINNTANAYLNQAAGIHNGIVNLETIELKPGNRLHLRLGAGSNPNQLETVFNGQVTEVQTGDILTIIAQSDAAELGSVVNTSNEKGHTGKVRGAAAASGLYMSEPRDLMIGLLTEKSSISREYVALASRGEIYSQGRHGISHFGRMLYTSTDTERDKMGRQKQLLSTRIADQAEREGTSSLGMKDMGDVILQSLFTDFWTNLSTQRDTEIFKRNIYPGNGLGIAQFMGGDLGDLVLEQVIAQGTGVDENGSGSILDPLTGNEASAPTIQEGIDAAREAQGLGENPSPSHAPLGPRPGVTFEGVSGKLQYEDPLRPLLGKFNEDILGLTSPEDDGAFDEVSFRAQTYMKTVWDLFKVCAALLPDYIVAVRPFEERSTVFYGKPHWLYTSGVIPLSTGTFPKDGPDVVRPNDELRSIIDLIDVEADRRDGTVGDDIISRVEAMGDYTRIGDISPNDPTSTIGGMNWSGAPESILNIPTPPDAPQLPHSVGPVGIEMHLPTSPNLEQDIANQAESNQYLPKHHQHPFYMDRGLSDANIRGGKAGINDFNPNGTIYDQTVLRGENPNNPGQPGAYDYLDPEIERWYMCQYTVGTGISRDSVAFQHVLIYCPRTKKAVVAAFAEQGPAHGLEVIAGISPEGWHALGQPSRSEDCLYRVVSKDVPLGPVSFSGAGTYVPPNIEIGAPTTSPGGGSPPSGIPSGVEGASPPVVVGAEELPAWAEPYGAEWQDKAFKDGYRIEGIPVNYTRTAQTELDYTGAPVGPEETGGYIYYDEVGELASAVYREFATEEQANAIWDEFRTRFASDPEVQNAFLSSLMTDELSEEQKRDLLQAPLYQEKIQEFQQYMWRNGPARGWIVRMADRQSDWGNLVPFAGGGEDWEQSIYAPAFEEFLREGESGLDAYIKENNTARNKKDDLNDNPLSNVFDSFGNSILDVKDSVTDTVRAIWGVAGNVLDFMRVSIAQMTGASIEASNAQLKANLLNRTYNDSIYYSAGVSEDGRVVNKLLYWADNPFTREYGEPVVEVREPFQRVHTLSSFSHIMNNNIYETTQNVANVITAVSDGGNPVTVHFDKGIEPDRQVEKVVETGLFYDDPSFWGSFLSPINATRGVILKMNGQSPEISAKRVALWHLKENLKDIYQGELTIMGDASIRPHDLVYLADVYERMYGWFEVEEVVHHFSPGIGFVTTIKPNACVTINDPSRFYFMANQAGRRSRQAMREILREKYNVRVDATVDSENNQSRDELPGSTSSEYLDLDSLTQELEDSILDQNMYYGGSSTILKGLLGSMSATASAQVGGGVIAGVVGSGGLGAIPLYLGWKGWKWYKDNILDQHGANIAYLTHKGEPMDAGLYYAQGVAVGQQNSVGLVLGGMKLGDIATLGPDGERKIRTQDVIKRLQPSEISLSEQAREVDLFVDGTLAELALIAGKGGELLLGNDAVIAYWVQIKYVVDADTFDFEVLGQMVNGQYREGRVAMGGTRLRLLGAQASEDPYNRIHDLEERARLSALNPSDPGIRATNYAREQLLGRKVALRVLRARQRDDTQSERLLGYMFHHHPSTGHARGDVGSEGEIRDHLLGLAYNAPLKAWNSFDEDGNPITFDWELIIKGHADTIASPFGEITSDAGVTGSTRGE